MASTPSKALRVVVDAARLGSWMVASVAASARAEPRALVFEAGQHERAPSLARLPELPRGPGLSLPWLTVGSCVVQDARACSMQSSARPDAHGDYLALPAADEAANDAADAFAEQMLYVHALRTLDYFRQRGLALPWTSAHPLRLVANVRTPGPAGDAPSAWADALFVSAGAPTGTFASLQRPGEDLVLFGQGDAVRLAYDADVVSHELTHAALDAFLPRARFRLDAAGASAEPAAIDEALADYFAAVLGGNALIAEHASRGAAPWQSRNLDAVVTCAEGLSGKRHVDALVLSSALWALRTSLAEARRTELDTALVHAIKALGTDGALGHARLFAALDAALPDTELRAQAARVLAQRGLPCARELPLVLGQTLASPAGLFSAPGTQALGLALAPGILQFRVEVPTGAQRLRLRLHSASTQLVLVAKQAQPIAWRGPTHDGVQNEPRKAANRTLTFELDVEGPAPHYLQLANAGTEDTTYDMLALAFGRATVAPSPSIVSTEVATPPETTKRPWLWAGALFSGVLFVALRLRRRR